MLSKSLSIVRDGETNVNNYIVRFYLKRNEAVLHRFLSNLLFLPKQLIFV